MTPALRSKLRAAAVRLDKAVAERDRLMAEAKAAGASNREIAALVGLSHVGVANILERRANETA
ncbi:MAG TPA: hypothetical protein PLV68_03945 [Ilumatobacteraceae bacterium]|nr:hypothetical protein [Ilumatobacteraceae bacterium]